MTQDAPKAPNPEAGKEEEKPAPLYASYQKVYPREVKGTFRTLKNWAAIILLGIYFVGPWLRWDRGAGAPNQAILLDMAHERGYILGVEIWAQEIYYLTGVLIIAAIGLFFATSLLGRVWCGFTCIQTVYTDVFVMIERWIEGDRTQRIKLDRGGMTAGKFARKTLKIGLWALLSLATGWTWVIYFNDAPSTTLDLIQMQASVGKMGFACLVAGFTFLLAGWAREQVCIYMCPWPRFQASMVDEHSLIVTYESWRGEPRSFAKKNTTFENRGHCVDCGNCVQSCPTGIDIRNGSQLACIGCGLCIDACNTIMDRYGLPRGLITYDSNTNQLAREHGKPTAFHFFRPRTLIYMAVMTTVVGVMAFGLTTRTRVELHSLHERSPLFVALSDGQIRNGYTIRVLNMENHDVTYTLATDEIPGATVQVVGYTDTPVASIDLPVKRDTVETFRVYVTAPPSALKGNATDLQFKLTNKETGGTVHNKNVFAAP